MNRSVRRMGLAMLAAGPSSALPADDAPAPGTSEAPPQHRLLNDRFRLSLGVFRADTSTEARLSTSRGGTGVDVNFEDTLRLPNPKLVGEANLYWRITERWRLDVDYFSINRSSTRTVQRDIAWGDNVFPVGTSVSSEFKMSDLRAALGYSFFRRSDKELGIGLGLHRTSFKATLDAPSIGAAGSSVTAPLPVASIYGSFALTNTWAFSVRSDWLSLSYGKYSGNVLARSVDFVYQPFKHFAFGFGVHALSLKLEVQNADSNTQVRFLSQGPAAFASYSY